MCAYQNVFLAWWRYERAIKAPDGPAGAMKTGEEKVMVGDLAITRRYSAFCVG